MSDTESQPIDDAEIDAAVGASGGAADASTRRISPGWVIWLLIVLATILGMGATLNGWINRQALDTDEWVSVTDEMLADDDIRGALATYLSAQLFTSIDVAGQLEQVLPGPAAQLAGPITTIFETNSVDRIDQLLATEQFGSLWSNINRAAHTAFVKLANGEDIGAMSTSDGAFVVDVRSLLIELADRLGLPGVAVSKIPETAGQLVVFESDQVDSLQQLVQVVDALSIYLFVLVILLYGAAVFWAQNRRATLRNVGVSIIVGSLLLLVAQRITLNVGVEELARAENGRAAVESLLSIATGLLNELAWAWLAIGVVVALYAVLVGPSRVAVAVRGFLVPVMIHPVGAWALALGALGLYLLLAPGFSVQRWLPILVLLGLFVVAVELLRRQICREHAAAPAPAES